jgi:hypothetical protein
MSTEIISVVYCVLVAHVMAWPIWAVWRWPM